MCFKCIHSQWRTQGGAEGARAPPPREEKVLEGVQGKKFAEQKFFYSYGGPPPKKVGPPLEKILRTPLFIVAQYLIQIDRFLKILKAQFTCIRKSI
jgi:hypothetical protein